jgi:hypothetical protein
VFAGLPAPRSGRIPGGWEKVGAGDGTRTRDIQLGRLELYQLSYSRSEFAMKVVEGGGFEPPKASPTDLQSVPFDRSGTPPQHGVAAIWRILGHLVLGVPSPSVDPTGRACKLPPHPDRRKAIDCGRKIVELRRMALPWSHLAETDRSEPPSDGAPNGSYPAPTIFGAQCDRRPGGAYISAPCPRRVRW